MDKGTYESLLNRARIARSVGVADGDYVIGYQRGLSRAHFGEHFDTDAEHELWLDLAGDPMREQRGRGYRDGLAGLPVSFK